ELYEQTFPGRWMVDGLKIKAGDATGVDILDGDKSTVGITGCGRNELTFSRGGGGVIAAIDGPVRAIRSYVGANSGTYTQRDQIYYRGRFDTHTYLRVHAGISPLWTAMDLAATARGMTYRNSLNPSGDVVDGVAASLAAGELEWEQVTGSQGTFTNVTRIDSDIPDLRVSSRYLDTEVAGDSTMGCSGDEHAYGAGGAFVSGTQVNTDPVREQIDGHLFRFNARRQTVIGAPGETVEAAQGIAARADLPLVLTTGGVHVDSPSDPKPDPGPPDAGAPQFPGRQNWVGLKVRVRPANTKLKAGTARNVKVRVRNIGDRPALRLKVCPSPRRSALVRTSKCRTVGRLKPGRAVTRRFRVRLRKKAAGADRVRIRFRAKAHRSKARSATLVLRPSG
ncbi:MAG: hypothetical protein M3Y45_01720, partial [Actinomycetota bacterium]|nr:hypothetical protein [Actinomycetota bacterium]